MLHSVLLQCAVCVAVVLQCVVHSVVLQGVVCVAECSIAVCSVCVQCSVAGCRVWCRVKC